MSIARRALVCGLLTLIAPLTGCLTLIKQSISEVRGAQADVLPIDESGAGRIAQASSVRFERPASSVGHICPASLIEAYDEAGVEGVRSLRDAFAGGPPVIVVTSELMYFQKRGLFSEAQCLTRVKLRDGEHLLVDAIVRAESGSFRESENGEAALAGASIKALAEYLRGYKQPPNQADEERPGKR